LVAKREQLIARTTVHERSKLAAPALCPAIPEVKISNDGCACFEYPKRSGRMSVKLRRDRKELG
jgi:hypothetical protein